MGCYVPIIALSANMRTEGQLSAQTVFSDYIDKPICIPRLGAAIEKFVLKEFLQKTEPKIGQSQS